MESQTKLMQLVRVAELYYEQQLSQVEISDMLGISRSTVSRLLAEAHEQGVVEITIHRPVEKVVRLSEMVRKTFGLRDAVVVRGGETYEEVLYRVGLATAEMLLSVLKDDQILGISWGVTLYNVVQAIRKTPLRGVEVIQLMGSLGHGNPATDGPELALRLAERLNGTYRIISAPAVVQSREVRDQLMQQPQIQNVLNKASQARIFLTGVGSFADDMSSLIRAGYLSMEDRADLRSRGAVGHILSWPIDIHGKEVQSDLSDRIVAASLDNLRNAEWSIACVASPLKAPAVLGTVRGRLHNALVCDEATARELLRLAENQPVGDAQAAYSR